MPRMLNRKDTVVEISLTYSCLRKRKNTKKLKKFSQRGRKPVLFGPYNALNKTGLNGS